MGSKVRFLHLNMNRSFVARDGLKQLVLESSLDIVSLNEPHVQDSATGAPSGFTEVHSGELKFRAAESCTSLSSAAQIW